MQRVFFYGLFMDDELLRDMGLDPRVEGPAELRDYRLRIGNKATLVAAPGSIAYGIVMALADHEVKELYSTPGVADYRPEPVTVVMASDQSSRDVSCYNLPAGEEGREANVEYAEKLAALATRLEFPATYVDEILQFCS